MVLERTYQQASDIMSNFTNLNLMKDIIETAFEDRANINPQTVTPEVD